MGITEHRKPLRLRMAFKIEERAITDNTTIFGVDLSSLLSIILWLPRLRLLRDVCEKLFLNAV